MSKLTNFITKYEPISTPNFLPVIWSKAKDCYVWDIHNKRYIDFTSGIFVTNCGHSNKIIKNQIKDQLDKHLCYSYNYPTTIRRNYIKELLKLCPSYFDKAYLLSTGSEAVECAIKLIRQNTSRRGIISFKDSMHGKTLLAENLKNNSIMDNPNWEWLDFSAYIYNLDFPTNNNQWIEDKRYLESIGDLGGIIIESYQGWSAKFYPRQYIQDLCKWAKEHKILVCFDEVQGGFGRTGNLFTYQYYDVKPDIVCLGKAIGNGYPLSAVICRKKILDFASDLSSTYGGNPISCAAGLGVLKQIRPLIASSYTLGEILHHKLNELKKKCGCIKEINGKGLLAAIIIDKKIADKICLQAMQNGLLLVHTGRESIKIGPPLTITKDLLLKGLNILDKSIKETTNGL